MHVCDPWYAGLETLVYGIQGCAIPEVFLSLRNGAWQIRNRSTGWINDHALSCRDSEYRRVGLDIVGCRMVEDLPDSLQVRLAETGFGRSVILSLSVGPASLTCGGNGWHREDGCDCQYQDDQPMSHLEKSSCVRTHFG